MKPEKYIKTFDMDGLQNYCRDMADYQKQVMNSNIDKAEAFYNGYKAATNNLLQILTAGNYQVERESEANENVGR